MKAIQKDNFVFCVDIDKNREYYLSNTSCNCPECRNLYAQIKTLSDELTNFLLDFGVDICRPDEASSVAMNNCIDYLFVGYTVTGKLETEGIYEADFGHFHIKITKGDTRMIGFQTSKKNPAFSFQLLEFLCRGF